MANHPLALLLRHLRHLAGAGPEAERTDRQLLQRFAANGDEDAFALLMRRHGAMVFGVCRRLLSNSHDAEDAFQATFVLLAQKAASAHWQESVAGWLHEAAQRVARHARRLAARRHGEERQAAALRAEAVTSPETDTLRRLWLDEELHRLPEKHRMPLVLCHLEGHSHEEAARLLGWPIGTVKGRLARALEQLRRRLRNHGEPWSASSLAVVLAERLPSAVPPETLARTTINVAVLVARGAPVAETVSASVAALLAGTFASKVKTAMALVMLLGVLATGAAVAARRLAPDTPPERASSPTPPTDRAAIRTDQYGDPLPPGAIARLGCMRLQHGDHVCAIAYSPDGKLLASGDLHGQVRLWDTRTGKEVRRLRGHDSNIYGFAFSPNGKLLASCGSFDRSSFSIVPVWDVDTGKRLFQVSHLSKKHGFQHATSVAFSPDGKALASGGFGGIYLWDVNTHNVLHYLQCPTMLDTVAFSPDGATLFSANRNEEIIRRWGVAKGEELPPLTGYKKGLDRPSTIAIDAKGRSLASSGGDGVCRIWDLSSGKVRLRISGGNGKILYPTFSPDRKTLAGISGNQVHFWDVASGKELRQFKTDGWALGLTFSPDGSTLAWWNKTAIYLADAQTGRPRFPHEGHTDLINKVAFSSDGMKVFTSGADTTIRIWDARTGRELHRCTESVAAFSPDGKTAASMAKTIKGVRLWDTVTGKDLLQLRVGANFIRNISDNCTFSANGKYIAAWGGMKDAIRVWETATGKERGQIPVDWLLGRLALSPDGQQVAAAEFAGFNKPIFIWDIDSGREIKIRLGKQSSANALAFSSDGTILAIGSSAGIRLWDVRTGKERDQLATPRGSWRIAFAPDGKSLAANGFDGFVYLWETATGKMRRRFDGCGEVAFSPDGKLLVTGEASRTALVWDVMDVGPSRGGRHAKPTAEVLTDCWAALGSEDAEKAWEAARTLVAGSEQTVSLLRERLADQATAAEKAARWIAELDDDSFAVRERASRELAALGKSAIPALRGAQANSPSAEVARRVKDLLAKLGKPGLSSVELASLRAVEVLEHLDTSEARQLLATLAKRAGDAPLIREARASLRRLEKRANKPQAIETAP